MLGFLASLAGAAEHEDCAALHGDESILTDDAPGAWRAIALPASGALERALETVRARAVAPPAARNT